MTFITLQPRPCGYPPPAGCGKRLVSYPFLRFASSRQIDNGFSKALPIRDGGRSFGAAFLKLEDPASPRGFQQQQCARPPTVGQAVKGCKKIEFVCRPRKTCEPQVENDEEGLSEV
jgi:hypothetical protein